MAIEPAGQCQFEKDNLHKARFESDRPDEIVDGNRGRSQGGDDRLPLGAAKRWH